MPSTAPVTSDALQSTRNFGSRNRTTNVQDSHNMDRSKHVHVNLSLSQETWTARIGLVNVTVIQVEHATITINGRCSHGNCAECRQGARIEVQREGNESGSSQEGSDDTSVLRSDYMDFATSMAESLIFSEDVTLGNGINHFQSPAPVSQSASDAFRPSDALASRHPNPHQSSYGCFALMNTCSQGERNQTDAYTSSSVRQSSQLNTSGRGNFLMPTTEKRLTVSECIYRSPAFSANNQSTYYDMTISGRFYVQIELEIVHLFRELGRPFPTRRIPRRLLLGLAQWCMRVQEERLQQVHSELELLKERLSAFTQSSSRLQCTCDFQLPCNFQLLKPSSSVFGLFSAKSGFNFRKCIGL
ncbi:hypothetical protein SISSUDRAFT_1055188 [Sistotremastrum suecicum HHB10207 ss-3]|uniref:Uncharacterized protein n=1 Tax=Sistotremastrum suecicum HHB10207 ss-3 TaxID=1314776 RepID=A0A165XZ50_9AGAM|nr:hypothetical protein SISSUDRAFT_1055188 [Sistotremastrum suecicum HHB10207 ss-3]